MSVVSHLVAAVGVIKISVVTQVMVVVMLALLLGMDSDRKLAKVPELTTRQVTIFFTVYVFFQVWNEINCRSLVPEVSGLTRLLQNPVFLAIMGLIVLGQVLIVTFGGDVFKVEPLSILDWLLIALGTASVLAFAEGMRRLRLRYEGKLLGRAMQP